MSNLFRKGRYRKNNTETKLLNLLCIHVVYKNNIKTILNTSGYSGLWEAQSVPNSKWLKIAISQKLEDSTFRPGPQ